MATLYKRGDSYCLNWYDAATGKQRRKSLGKIDAGTANLRLAEQELILAGGTLHNVSGGMLFGHFVLREYLPWHAVRFPDSHFRVKQICEQCFLDFATVPLDGIRRHDVERWLAQRMARVGHNRRHEVTVVSSETAAKELRTLKAVLHAAVRWGKLRVSPASGVTPPKSKRSAPIHFYSAEELALLATAPHGCVWRLLANTGLRRAEAQHLQWGHVSVADAELRVLSTDDARTKSGKWRLVPLSAGAIEALKALMPDGVPSTTDYVLPRMTGPSLSRLFMKEARELGLPGSIHSLRHSYGSHLVMSRVPLRAVQALMGHQSFITTERYAHVGEDHLRAAARAVSL